MGTESAVSSEASQSGRTLGPKPNDDVPVVGFISADFDWDEIGSIQLAVDSNSSEIFFSSFPFLFVNYFHVSVCAVKWAVLNQKRCGETFLFHWSCGWFVIAAADRMWDLSGLKHLQLGLHILYWFIQSHNEVRLTSSGGTNSSICLWYGRRLAFPSVKLKGIRKQVIFDL